MNVTLAYAEAVLAPYHERLARVVHTAWERWTTAPDAAFDRRARAAAVWCYMKSEAQLLFEDDPAVKTIEGNNTFLLIVADRLVVRFKKMDEHGASRNVETNLQCSFRDELGEIKMEGIPARLPRVEVGYVLNRLEDGIREVRVSAPRRRGTAWSYVVQEQADVRELPTSQTVGVAGVKTKTATTNAKASTNSD